MAQPMLHICDGPWISEESCIWHVLDAVFYICLLGPLLIMLFKSSMSFFFLFAIYSLNYQENKYVLKSPNVIIYPSTLICAYVYFCYIISDILIQNYNLFLVY